MNKSSFDIRKKVVEETENFMVIDLDCADMKGWSDCEVLEEFLSKGFECMSCHGWTQETKTWMGLNSEFTFFKRLTLRKIK